jgi:hypothetical protein
MAKSDFNPLSKKNIILFLSALLVFLFGYLALRYKPSLNTKQAPVTTSSDEKVEMIRSQSESDSTDQIEKDLLNTDVSNIDEDLQSIETEINAATN